MRPNETENKTFPSMAVLEAETNIGNEVTLQIWFARQGANISRTEVYKFENGTVVAYRDCLDGENTPLYMDLMFKSLYEDEPAFWTILHYAGVSDPRKVETYCTGR